MRALIIVAALFLVGCSQDSDWHHGTWKVEVPTEEIGEDSPPEKIAAGFWAYSFADATVTIGADEITFTLGDRAMTTGYVVAERVSSSEIRIVLDDDAVHRIRESDHGIEVTVNGTGDLAGAEGAWVSFAQK